MMKNRPKLLLIVSVLVLSIGALIAFDRLSPAQKGCQIKYGDAAAYKAFLDAQGDNRLDVVFEVTKIRGAISGQTTRGIYACPTSLEGLGNVNTQAQIGDRLYTFNYERLSDQEYTLSVGIEGERIQVAQ